MWILCKRRLLLQLPLRVKHFIMVALIRAHAEEQHFVPADMPHRAGC